MNELRNLIANEMEKAYAKQGIVINTGTWQDVIDGKVAMIMGVCSNDNTDNNQTKILLQYFHGGSMSWHSDVVTKEEFKQWKVTDGMSSYVKHGTATEVIVKDVIWEKE